jgi:hypothetical protein
MIFMVLDLLFEPTSVEKHTWNPNWALNPFFDYFLGFWVICDSILGTQIDTKSILILNGFWFLF